MPMKDCNMSAVMKDLEEAGVVLPTTLPFKSTQLSERYRKGQARGRHWKHLKQILQAENYHLYPIDEPNCMCSLVNIICAYISIDNIYIAI